MRWQDRILYLFDTGGINEEAMWQQSWRECVCAFVKNSFDKKIEVSHVCIRLRIIALVFRSITKNELKQRKNRENTSHQKI